MTDLVVLAADLDIEQSISGLLGRHQSLGIRPLTYETIRHPGRDPGCYHSSHQLLRPYVNLADHALVILDAAWEGRPSDDAAILEADVNSKLEESWGSAARCVVIDPEIEQWAWSASPHVERILGWYAHDPPLRTWLHDHGLWPDGSAKPADPKEAFEQCLREVQIKPSAAIFGELARKVGLTTCSDPSFSRLLVTLREWFAAPE